MSLAQRFFRQPDRRTEPRRDADQFNEQDNTICLFYAVFAIALCVIVFTLTNEYHERRMKAAYLEIDAKAQEKVSVILRDRQTLKIMCAK